jgi:hypothetical protein
MPSKSEEKNPSHGSCLVTLIVVVMWLRQTHTLLRPERGTLMNFPSSFPSFCELVRISLNISPRCPFRTRLPTESFVFSSSTDHFDKLPSSSPFLSRPLVCCVSTLEDLPIRSMAPDPYQNAASNRVCCNSTPVMGK